MKRKVNNQILVIFQGQIVNRCVKRIDIVYLKKLYSINIQKSKFIFQKIQQAKIKQSFIAHLLISFTFEVGRSRQTKIL